MTSFEEHVERALESLPAELRAAMENVESWAPSVWPSPGACRPYSG